MKQATVQDKILDLEVQLATLRKLVQQKPDFKIDEQNWQKMKATVRAARKERFTKLYEL